MASVYPPPNDTAHSPKLHVLTGVFARDANLTFGGGSATAETLRRELVDRRRWLTAADFRLAYAASRLAPATNLLALCTAVGWRVRGRAGAFAALLASSVPSAIIVAVVMMGYEHVQTNQSLAHAVRGAVAVSAALLLSSAWALVRPHAVSGRRFRAMVIVGVSLAAHELLGLSALTVLMTSALVGAAWDEEPGP